MDKPLNQILTYNEIDYHFYSLLNNYYKKKYNSIINLENIHKLLNSNEISDDCKNYFKKIPIFGKTDRNSVFVKDFYNYYDNDYSFFFEYLNFIKNVIKPLFKSETILVIQKTPNIRFHLPGCSNIGKRETDKYEDIIGLHNDSEFGHPEEEINVVLPITKMFETNSIYYEEYPNSKIDVHNYSNLNLNKCNFFLGYLNKCNHYNKINKTEQTRVSLDFRIIPYSKFKKCEKSSATFNLKFEVGNYYVLI
jgi:hypothetical protein